MKIAVDASIPPGGRERPIVWHDDAIMHLFFFSRALPSSSSEEGHTRPPSPQSNTPITAPPAPASPIPLRTYPGLSGGVARARPLGHWPDPRRRRSYSRGACYPRMLCCTQRRCWRLCSSNCGEPNVVILVPTQPSPPSHPLTPGHAAPPPSFRRRAGPAWAHATDVCLHAW
jgi:hypothetical protein